MISDNNCTLDNAIIIFISNPYDSVHARSHKLYLPMYISIVLSLTRNLITSGLVQNIAILAIFMKLYVPLKYVSFIRIFICVLRILEDVRSQSQGNILLGLERICDF